ncbi:MAG: hypothetical protein IIV57_06635 [Bacteroidaceae bacterium]|nr:hypothetical protein [Bacteroidaceae bacterium]
MIIHYLKTAWRNLLKYKTQNTISVLSLAVGLTMIAWQSIGNGYRFSNNRQICCCNLIGEVITSPYETVGS